MFVALKRVRGRNGLLIERGFEVGMARYQWRGWIISRNYLLMNFAYHNMLTGMSALQTDVLKGCLLLGMRLGVGMLRY